MEELQRGGRNALLLQSSDVFFRGGRHGGGPRLHLYKMHAIGRFRDKVQLQVSAVPVAGEDRVAPGREIVRGEVFA